MPFKIGDKVKIVRINRAPIDRANEWLGGIFVITNKDSLWDGEESWYSSFFIDGKFNPYRWKESELELVEEPKKKLRFEVGKKYEGKYTKEVKTCLWSDDVGALLENHPTRNYLPQQSRQHYTEYVPPPPKPVHHEGWVHIGKNKNIWKTKEEAMEALEKAGSGQTIATTIFVEWDEPSVVYGKNTETEDDSDDDTV